LSEGAREATAESVSVRLLGSSFVATSVSTTAIDHIRRLWSPFVVNDIADDGSSDDGAVVVALDHPTDAVRDCDRLATFAVAVNAAALDRAPDFAVHCAVVACGETAIAMPATSGVGKSTLTAACLRFGFRYVSDEALCLREPDGRVVAYPRPIALSAWSARAVDAPTPGVEAGEELLFTADDLGSRVATEELRVRHIVLLDRRPAGPPAIHEAQRPAAVTRLLELSFNHYRRPANAVELAAAAVGEASVWTLEYSNPLAAARLLWSRFGDSAPNT
jgi:hypothetical protein